MCLLYSEEDKLYVCTMTAWHQEDPLYGFRTNFSHRGLGPARTYTFREYVDKDVILEVELCVQHGEVFKETITTSKKVMEFNNHLCGSIEVDEFRSELLEGEYERVWMYRYKCTGCGQTTYNPPSGMVHHLYKWRYYRESGICGQYLEDNKVLGYKCKRCGLEFLNYLNLFNHLRGCVIDRK